jgi:K+-sensing histidine kinase KdpD
MKTESKSGMPLGQSALDRLSRENARLRGDLLTVAQRISHDLRSPLGGIITNCEVLREILATNDVASESLLAPIFDSAEEMKKLIERVSFVLRASTNPKANARVQMGDIVFRVLQSVESKVLKKNMTVSEPAIWPQVMGVPSWLEVVWQNLLLNALCHGKNRIELGWEEGHGEFRFWVSDDGNVVPGDKREKLFQPFDSLHEPGATRGLGLSIVQRLVLLQGGRCGYETRPAGGSCFYFTLPADNLLDTSGSSPAQETHNEGHPFGVKL